MDRFLLYLWMDHISLLHILIIHLTSVVTRLKISAHKHLKICNRFTLMGNYVLSLFRFAYWFTEREEMWECDFNGYEFTLQCTWCTQVKKKWTAFKIISHVSHLLNFRVVAWEMVRF